MHHSWALRDARVLRATCSTVESSSRDLQTLEQYCEAHPDSTFARDIAMNKDDIRNVTRRTLPNLWELHPDTVSSPL